MRLSAHTLLVVAILVIGSIMSACFRREMSPILRLSTREGMLQLGQNTIQVFRWGLRMAPIIFTFLRPMADPTWYNQDGAIRSLLSTCQYLTSSPEAFRSWSLSVFVSILALDSVRILIWLDHMGLRVATLVNLSFIGMDRLDRRLARCLGPAATAQCLPESVKRFATWAPLLIPFYLPRGADWDYVWSHAEALRAARNGMSATAALPPWEVLLLIGTAMVCTTALPVGLASAPGKHPAVPRTQQLVAGGRAGERHVLPRRSVADWGCSNPFPAVPVRGEHECRPGLCRGGLAVLEKNLSADPRDTRRD